MLVHDAGVNLRTVLALLTSLLIAAVLFGVGLTWGLPSGEVNRYLFGTHPVWSGAEILKLAPAWQSEDRAADVASSAIADRDRPQVVNGTDADRAALVRRYRLYSAQPDEMITLRALAQMKPGKLQLDPKLYQYGGLWVYPIGALAKVASLLRLVSVSSDIAFYLDHPEAFGRMYVVMRLYSVFWGLVAVAVASELCRRITVNVAMGWIAALLIALCPTVINAAHEAKPHLGGAALTLVTLAAAWRAVESGERRWVVAAGVAAGAAIAMVLSGTLAILMLPVMAWMLPQRRVANGLMAVALAIGVYAICNPYVLIHLVGDHAMLASNLGNTSAMYEAPPSVDGVISGFASILRSGSLVVMVGIFVMIVGVFRRDRLSILIAAGTMPGMILFLMHAAGKPGEYGRFALPMEVLWVVGAIASTAWGPKSFPFPEEKKRLQFGTALILTLATLPGAISYVWHYGRETFDRSTRLIAADRMRDLQTSGAKVLAVDAEPAPYCLPPVDLFAWRIELLPKSTAFTYSCPPEHSDVRIDPVDMTFGFEKQVDTVQYWIRPRLMATPISWAAKPFRVQLSRGVAAAELVRPSPTTASAGSGDRR